MATKFVQSVLQTALAGILGITVLTAGLQGATVEPVNKDRAGVALKGYDPVAYFQQARPVKGCSQYTHSWMGATWQFASSADRDLFAANPEKYTPQFGGYCSWAVSRNHTADVDPQAWKIIDGKLYLNYNREVQKKWEQDVEQRIEAARKNWPHLHK